MQSLKREGVEGRLERVISFPAIPPNPHDGGDSFSEQDTITDVASHRCITPAKHVTHL